MLSEKDEAEYEEDDNRYEGDEDDEEIDIDEGYTRRHRRSLSDSNFETFFANHRNSTLKENQDDSGCFSRNSANHVDSASNDHDKGNLKNLESDFKVLMYLEDKNEAEEDNLPAVPEQPKVEKKLDSLFRQEVPLNNIYYDAEPQPSTNTSKVPQQKDGGMNFFGNDMGRDAFTQNST